MNIYLTNAAIQASSFEKEIHHDCLSCAEPITNPLCPECIGKGFKQWIGKFTTGDKGIIEKLDHFLKNHKHLDGNSIKCASCRKNTTHICPYCFTEYLYKLTKEAGLGVCAMTEFLFIFNFDFEHDGYSRELEVLGGY